MDFIFLTQVKNISAADVVLKSSFTFMILYNLMAKYMSTRVGKKPEEYSKEETKYDEIGIC